MWGREVDGVTLTFHLAGINNQNFLMRDEETGTYWQQISGRAVSGPLAGKTLPLIHCDELTFALWKSEQPNGSILKDVAAFAPNYSPKNWDIRMKHAPTVISHAQPGIVDREVMLGVRAGGAARAFPYEAVKREKLVVDQVGSAAILLVLGPDNQSVRAFLRTLPDGRGVAEFYRTGNEPAFMMDSISGSSWSFQGCAIEGTLKGACLSPVEVIKDYWFDWREYNPHTTVYQITARR